MKRAALIIVIALYAAPALAQNSPAFVPYTITAEQHQALMTYLNEQPFKVAAPIIQNLNQLEQQAVQAKAAADAKATADKPKEKK